MREKVIIFFKSSPALPWKSDFPSNNLKKKYLTLTSQSSHQSECWPRRAYGLAGLRQNNIWLMLEKHQVLD